MDKEHFTRPAECYTGCLRSNGKKFKDVNYTIVSAKSLSQHGSANKPFARYCTFCVKIRYWLGKYVYLCRNKKLNIHLARMVLLNISYLILADFNKMLRVTWCSRCSKCCPRICTQHCTLLRIEFRILSNTPGSFLICWQAPSVRCCNSSQQYTSTSLVSGGS
jgi:hypothetical protein